MKILKEKFVAIRDFFDRTEDRGKNFLYNLLTLMRDAQNDKINLARLAYLLTRLEPDKKAGDEKIEAYQRFSKQIYTWSLSKEDCRQTIMAIYLYTYLTREGEDEDDLK